MALSHKEIWHQFCEELKHAGDVLERATTPQSDVTRSTGLRLLARNISLAMQFQMENADSLNPELLHYFDPLRKQGGDNTDALYVGAPINGTDTYVVEGYRGSAAYFAVTVLEDGATPWGGAVVGSLINDDLQCDADGRFRLVISPEPHEGNWIKSTPNTWRLTFRQFFADWENENPMRAMINRISATKPTKPVEPPEPLDVKSAESGLMASARWLRESVLYWADMLDRWQQRPNEFLAYGELESNAIDFTPGGAPMISYWRLPKDEALILRVTPPACAYWAVEFGNYWWETMDYRNRLSNLNQHYAELEEDGSLVVVISHDDTGYPNWLDPSGHEEGYVTFRWIGAESYPRPSCEQLSIKQLDKQLCNAKRITQQARREQLAARRRGVINRFGT